MGETSIGRAANLHLALALDVVKYGDLEALESEWGVVEGIAEGLREVNVGGTLCVEPPREPGLGVRVRSEVLEKYRVRLAVVR